MKQETLKISSGAQEIFYGCVLCLNKISSVCKSPFMSSYHISKYLMWWPISKRIKGNIFVHRKNIFRGPTSGVKSKESGISKLSEYYAVGKLVSGEAWPNAKGISSIGPTCWEKTSKTCQNIGIFWVSPKTEKSDQMFDVFSWFLEDLNLND